jgi:hypothetical protein
MSNKSKIVSFGVNEPKLYKIFGSLINLILFFSCIASHILPVLKPVKLYGKTCAGSLQDKHLNSNFNAQSGSFCE